MSLPIQRLCTIFALAFCFGAPAHAIVNVLPVPGKEVSGLSGSATLKGSIKTGNTDIIDVGLRGLIGKATEYSIAVLLSDFGMNATGLRACGG